MRHHQRRDILGVKYDSDSGDGKMGSKDEKRPLLLTFEQSYQRALYHVDLDIKFDIREMALIQFQFNRMASTRLYRQPITNKYLIFRGQQRNR